MEEIIKLQNATVQAEVSLFGGMTTASFSVAGRKVNPFYIHSWAEEEAGDDQFLGKLRGDFFCLPFGGIPAGGWKEPDLTIGSYRQQYPHGYSCGGVWTAEAGSADSVRLRLVYPEEDGINETGRLIGLAENQIFFTDTATVKREVRLPVGIHPIFRLNEKPGSMQLHLPACASVRTRPSNGDESAAFEPGVIISDPVRVPLKTGEELNVTNLPLPIKTEEVLLLAAVKEGRVALDNLEEGYRVILEWDPSVYRHLLLWFSNYGRTDAPWNGRNLCLGMEPLTSAFDFGGDSEEKESPMKADGVCEAYFLKPGKPSVFLHSVRVEAL